MGLGESWKKEAKNEKVFHWLFTYPVQRPTFKNREGVAAHEEIAEALNASVNCVQPYALMYRKVNENTNELIRKYYS